MEDENFHIVTPWLTQKYQTYFHEKYNISYSTPYIGCLAITAEYSITPSGCVLPCFNVVEFLKPEHGNIYNDNSKNLSLLYHTFDDIFELNYFHDLYIKLHKSRAFIDYTICENCRFSEVCAPCPTMRLLNKKDEIVDICYLYDRMIREKII